MPVPMYESRFSPLHRLLNWSLPAGRLLAGIRVRLHWSLLVLPLIWVGINPANAGLGVNALLVVLFAVMLFGVVYLHELGHSLAALRCGVVVDEILLYIFGGKAILGGHPRNANQEFVITAFGPFVHLPLIAVALGALELVIQPRGLERWWVWDPRIGPGGFFQALFWLNVMLAAFNLVPMFPFDGGHLLRSLLAMRGNAGWATRTAARVGYVAATIMVAVAVLHLGEWGVYGWFLLFFAVDGYLNCYYEQQRARYGIIYEGRESWGEDFSAEGWLRERGPAKRPGFIVRYLERRRAAKAQKQHERQAKMRQRVDELLKKVKEQGISALTAEERGFLRRASTEYRRERRSE